MHHDATALLRGHVLDRASAASNEQSAAHDVSAVRGVVDRSRAPKVLGLSFFFPR